LQNVHHSVAFMFVVVTCYTEGVTFKEIPDCFMRLCSLDRGGIEICRYVLPVDGQHHHTAVNFCLIHRGVGNEWALKTLGLPDSHSRNYGMMIPALKAQLKPFIPDIVVRKSDRVSVLRKNQAFKISDCCDNVPDRFTVGLAWDVTGGKNIDLDASIIMLNENLQCADIVFYGKLVSNDGSIRHGGDEREGDEKGDDEKIHLHLDRVGDSVTYIGVVMNSYSGEELNDVRNAKCHIFNSDTHRDCCFYDIDADDSANLDKTAFLFVVLYRVKGEWWCHAIGEGAVGKTASENVDEFQAYIRKHSLVERKIAEQELMASCGEESIFNVQSEV